MTSDFKQNNAAVRYRFTRSEYDDRGPGRDYPPRDTWDEAAADAIEDGSAEWVRRNELRLTFGRIERVRT